MYAPASLGQTITLPDYRACTPARLEELAREDPASAQIVSRWCEENPQGGDVVDWAMDQLQRHGPTAIRYLKWFCGTTAGRLSMPGACAAVAAAEMTADGVEKIKAKLEKEIQDRARKGASTAALVGMGAAFLIAWLAVSV